ncbi:dihydrodipicolinate synthase family protein, partial [Mesorhizobium sp.]|uniref:dihydrodipicolinate synthase family protein n=1 Tax=Mesorhizobium sp. TaxID=1871066 RepID=UPI0025F495E4
MWAGVFPAVTTKFTPDDRLDHAEMERCFSLQMEAGCDGIIVCGSLGEGPMLSHDEKIEVLKTAQKVAGTKPVLLTVNEPGTREAASIARRAAKEGANGLMVVPSPIYHTNAEETVAALRAVAEAGDLPVMIYSNRLAYRVDVTVDLMEELASDKRIVRNPQKIKSVRDNAAFVDRVSKEHGGFGKFLADWPADDQVGLTAYLGKHGSRLGGNTGQYFLRWLEWDTFIVSADMAAALRDAGLDIAESPTSKRDLDKIQAQINRWSAATGLPR